MAFWLNLSSICWSIFSSIGIFSLLTSVALAELPSDPLQQSIEAGADNALSQVTSVSQLADVQPTDWALQALRSLAERYGCISGYPDGRYQGNRSLSRFEFAAELNACLDRITELLTTDSTNVSPSDLATLQRLQADFVTELAMQQGRIDGLETRTTELAAHQFSTTTRLNGEVLLALNGGGFEGDSIIDPTGVELANTSPNPALVYRTALIFNTRSNLLLMKTLS